MPNSLLCPNGDLKQPPLKDPLKTHTLVYHNLESSPTKSNDLFVTPRSDFSAEDPLRKGEYDALLAKHAKSEVTTRVGLSSAGSSLNSTPSSAADYGLLNNTKCPVNRICLINDELTSGPCFSPQAILLINDDELQGHCLSPLTLSSDEVVLSPQTSDSASPEATDDVIAEASGSSCSPQGGLLQPIIPYQCMEDSPIFSEVSAKDTEITTDDIITVEDELGSDNSVTKLMKTPETPEAPLPPANLSSYSKFFFMNCYSLFTQRTEPDTLHIAKDASKEQINSCDGGVLDTFGANSDFGSSKSSKQSLDYDRSMQSRAKPVPSADVTDETRLQDDGILDNAAELLRDVKIGGCGEKSDRKKHRRIISVVSQTSMTKKRDSTLGFKNYLKGLKPFDHDYNSGSMEHTLDMHHFSYNAPCKNFFMRYCPDTLHMQFAATRSMNNVNLFNRKSPLSTKSTVRAPQGRPILKDCSFHARSGELGVILGGSGSGKTTLLDAFSKRLDSRGYQSGKILLDGLRCTTTTVKHKLAYVIQHDRLLPNLTVEETLTFVAKLFYPTFNSDLIEEKVSDVLDELGLMHVKGSRVGDGLIRGVSGGERRRLSIACQLIKFTNILLLDEPTTGLDSFNAYNLIETLARLSRRNIVVVATIHQPRSELFPFFDVITLMSQGNIVYHGKQRNLIPYFTSLGYPCPVHQNPLDHYIDVVSVDRYTKDNQVVTESRLKALIQHYRRSPHYMTLMSDLGTRAYADVEWNECQSPCVVFYKMGLLVHRMNINVVRSVRAFGMRSTVGLIFALMLFAFMLRLSDDQAGMQNRIGLLFQIVNGPTYFGIMNAIDLYPALRDLFYRENLDGLYQPWQFILAYFLHVIPFTVVTTFMFSGLSYWGMGFFPAYDRWLYYSFVFLVLMFNGEVITVLILGAIQDPVLANGAVSLIMSMSITVGSGLIRNFQTLHPIFEMLSYGSMHRYASSCLATNEFTGLNLTCSEGEFCQWTSGEQYLNLTYPDGMGNEGNNFGILCSYVMSLAALALFIYSIIRIPRLR